MKDAIIWNLSHPDDYGLWAGKELIINEAGDNEPGNSLWTLF